MDPTHPSQDTSDNSDVPPPPPLLRCDHTSLVSNGDGGSYQDPYMKYYFVFVVVALLVEALPPSVKKELLEEGHG
jgi:hypothetical protein